MNELITIKSLTKTYNNGIEAVKGIDLSINEGEVYGLLGPNGAGKSTTISILVGHLKATSGEVLIDGKVKTGEISPDLVGYVPQEIILYEYLTVKENLKLFGNLFGANSLEKNLSMRINELISLLKLSDFQDQLIRNLSGGQKRRVNLAIGLLNNPKILVLDEPSVGMDPQSRNILWESLEKLSQNKITILLTTHLMEAADRLCDRIAIIDDGRILLEGTSKELKQSIGSNDSIVIKFKEDMIQSEEIEKVHQFAISVFGEEKVINHNSTIQIQTDIKFLDVLINKISELDLKPKLEDITMRSNTLEDVFISITGKKLRE
jgi:ABC-2 type transport system ATP-binding protein